LRVLVVAIHSSAKAKSASYLVDEDLGLYFIASLQIYIGICWHYYHTTFYIFYLFTIFYTSQTLEPRNSWNVRHFYSFFVLLFRRFPAKLFIVIRYIYKLHVRRVLIIRMFSHKITLFQILKDFLNWFGFWTLLTDIFSQKFLLFAI
jgi:hypothetical protein